MHMLEKYNSVIKVLLYCNLNFEETEDLPIRGWQMSYFLLESNTLHIRTFHRRYDLTIPLRSIVEMRKVTGKHALIHQAYRVGLIKLFRTGNASSATLPFLSGTRGFCIVPLYVAGPKNIFTPFWTFLTQRLRKVNVREEMKNADRILNKIIYLIYLGIDDLKTISLLLDLNSEETLTYLTELYEAGFLNSMGRLTYPAFKEASKAYRHGDGKLKLFSARSKNSRGSLNRRV